MMIVCGWFMCVTVFILGGITVLGVSGKYNLERQAVSYAAGVRGGVQAVSAQPGREDAWQEGMVRFDGRNYRYNEGILTFLLMGIDGEKEEISGSYTDGRQADALFLLVLDTHKEVITVIPVNRSTMTEINIYDEEGVCKDTVTAQICLQHGYGGGGKVSCEYQMNAVSNLFYGLPISGYLAVDMDVIPDVIELVGGIDLEVLEDVRGRNQEVILRQSEYAAEFITKVKRLMKKDFTLPVRIYNEISDWTVTDITADEVAYLAMTAGGYRFDAGQVITVPGRSVSGESNENSAYDEFYVDEEALYELVLHVFYEPAE